MRRFIINSQSGQIASKLPTVAVIGLYSAMSPSGTLGARHRGAMDFDEAGVRVALAFAGDAQLRGLARLSFLNRRQ
ncbi:MAG: hypothetical protein NTX56_07780 [Proteobacteria bacterium]|nr:hypothetical protein [Pseudomonadota bacterium]